MSRYRRADIKGATYFFTVVTERRQAILTNEDVREALRAAIIKVRALHPFEIDAWVLLPDHLHCIWTLPEGDADFSTRWRMIKREVTLAIGAKYFREDFQTERRAQKQQGTIWQPRRAGATRAVNHFNDLSFKYFFKPQITIAAS